MPSPRIEPEAVFGFKGTPRTDASLQDPLDALEWVEPAFELVLTHTPDRTFTGAQTVNDSMRLSRNGRRVDEGNGAKVLDSPLQTLRHFLAKPNASATSLSPA